MDGQSDPYVPLCLPGDTKITLMTRNKSIFVAYSEFCLTIRVTYVTKDDTSITKYCKHVYFYWGKIWRKGLLDCSCRCNYHDNNSIPVSLSLGYYFAQKEIFMINMKL